MYVPAAFRITDERTIRDFIEQNLFGIVVTQSESGPGATHLPMLFDHGENENGTLTGHIARANPQWKAFNGSTVLAIFQGPHGYISPSLYDGDRNVPTWDYTAVHVYGRASVVDDAGDSAAIVRRLTKRMEQTRENPWNVDALPADYVATMVNGIVAFRIAIERVEAQFKLSQNRSVAERRRIVSDLAQSGNETERALSPLIPL